MSEQLNLASEHKNVKKNLKMSKRAVRTNAMTMYMSKSTLTSHWCQYIDLRTNKKVVKSLCIFPFMNKHYDKEIRAYTCFFTYIIWGFSSHCRGFSPLILHR